MNSAANPHGRTSDDNATAKASVNTYRYPRPHFLLGYRACLQGDVQPNRLFRLAGVDWPMTEMMAEILPRAWERSVRKTAILSADVQSSDLYLRVQKQETELRIKTTPSVPRALTYTRDGTNIHYGAKEKHHPTSVLKNQRGNRNKSNCSSINIRCFLPVQTRHCAIATLA